MLWSYQDPAVQRGEKMENFWNKKKAQNQLSADNTQGWKTTKQTTLMKGGGGVEKEWKQASWKLVEK